MFKDSAKHAWLNDDDLFHIAGCSDDFFQATARTLDFRLTCLTLALNGVRTYLKCRSPAIAAVRDYTDMATGQMPTILSGGLGVHVSWCGSGFTSFA